MPPRTGCSTASHPRRPLPARAIPAGAAAAAILAESAPLVFEDFPTEGPDRVTLHSTATSSFLGNFSGLIHHLAATHEHVLFVLSSPGPCERIHDLCQEYGIAHAWKAGARWDDLELGKARRILITQGPLEPGFRLPELSLAVLGSEDIFPRTKRRPQEPKASRYRAVTAFFSDFKDLKPGLYDLVIMREAKFRLDGYNYPPVLEFDPFFAGDAPCDEGDQQCSGCIHFIAESNTCKLVEGQINPNGWCTLWVLKQG